MPRNTRKLALPDAVGTVVARGDWPHGRILTLRQWCLWWDVCDDTMRGWLKSLKIPSRFGPNLETIIAADDMLKAMAVIPFDEGPRRCRGEARKLKGVTDG